MIGLGTRRKNTFSPGQETGLGRIVNRKRRNRTMANGIKACGILSLGLLLTAASAMADFMVGGAYSVTGTNFVDNYTATTTLDQQAKLVDSGQLLLTETLYPDPSDPNSQWIDIYFQSVDK